MKVPQTIKTFVKKGIEAVIVVIIIANATWVLCLAAIYVAVPLSHTVPVIAAMVISGAFIIGGAVGTLIESYRRKMAEIMGSGTRQMKGSK